MYISITAVLPRPTCPAVGAAWTRPNTVAHLPEPLPPGILSPPSPHDMFGSPSKKKYSKEEKERILTNFDCEGVYLSPHQSIQTDVRSSS